MIARPHGLLIDQDGVAGFGHRHRWLRDLNDGWQLVETSGYDDPPDLRGPCEALAASTGYPVLAAFISDGRCVAMCAAAPGWVGPLTHLWPVSETCGIYRHQPRDMDEPAGRSVEEVVAELTDWSAAAGLRADVDRLRLLVGRDADRASSEVDDLVFEVVKALGLTRIGRTFPWSLPAYDWPFSGMMFSVGPAFQARVDAGFRAAGVRCIPPVEPWETSALALETELWASLYRPDIEVAALARRAAYLLAAYHADPTSTEDTDPPVLDERSLRLLARLESGRSEDCEERRYADARATTVTAPPRAGSPPR